MNPKYGFTLNSKELTKILHSLNKINHFQVIWNDSKVI